MDYRSWISTGLKIRIQLGSTSRHRTSDLSQIQDFSHPFWDVETGVGVNKMVMTAGWRTGKITYPEVRGSQEAFLGCIRVNDSGKNEWLPHNIPPPLIQQHNPEGLLWFQFGFLLWLSGFFCFTGNITVQMKNYLLDSLQQNVVIALSSGQENV